VTRSSDGRAVPRRLWVLNLDAEIELERAGRSYQSTLRVAQALAPMLPRARALLAPRDLHLAQPEVSGAGRELLLDARGEACSLPMPPIGARSGGGERWVGAAWSPTPTALRRLARAGAELPPCPSLEVLHRVNHRRFYLELGGGAPGARYVQNESDASALLAASGRTWLCKKPFGFAGRGQRRLPPEPSADDRRWLSDALRQGGFLAEPWLELALELGLHGLIEPSGQVRLGEICVQETDRFRAWVATRRADDRDLTPQQASELRARAESTAAALRVAGYFGPFGIDAYLYRTESGALALNSLGELNARYSMGFAIGLPGLR
jgi:hypothetical protein